MIRTCSQLEVQLIVTCQIFPYVLRKVLLVNWTCFTTFLHQGLKPPHEVVKVTPPETSWNSPAQHARLKRARQTLRHLFDLFWSLMSDKNLLNSQALVGSNSLDHVLKAESNTHGPWVFSILRLSGSFSNCQRICWQFRWPCFA